MATSALGHETPSPTRSLSAVRELWNRPLANYYVLLGSTVLLLIIGLLMVLSASSVYSFTYLDNSFAVVRRQLLWVAIAVPCAVIASRLSNKTIRRFAWPALLVSILLLAATLTPLGVTVNGNTNWLGVGPIQVQPSEIAKLGIVIWAAHIYAIKAPLLGQLRHVLIPVVPGVGAVLALVVLQRDLGTALVLAAILLAAMWVVGAPGRLFTVAFVTVSVAALFLAAISAERRTRITNFLDPFQDYHDSGWQPAHGLYALSTGGWWGQGIGGSRQKWGDLPEAHTDFIFAVLGEELGLLGTLLVLGLFFAIGAVGVRLALTTQDRFVRLMSFGVVVWLLGQMIVNVGMVTGVLPVIGIPLPLISYGGSALVPSLVALGLLIGVARREPDAAAALAERKSRP